MEEEIWKPVAVGVPDWAIGLFEISNLGRCRRAINIPTHVNTWPGFMLTPKVDNTSRHYHCRPRYGVRYWLKRNGKQYGASASRLVAFAFIPNDDPEHKTEVNHIDGNPMNNNVKNLEWVTPCYNMEHALKEGLTRTIGFVRLTDKNGKRRFFFSKRAASYYIGRNETYINKSITEHFPVRDAAGNFYALEVIPREVYLQNQEEYDRDL